MIDGKGAFATVPRRLEPVLAAELSAMGIEVEAVRGGVWLAGGLASAYRACLWSRVASRVLWPLSRFEAPSTDALYSAVRDLDWESHLPRGRTLAVDAVLVEAAFDHSHFAALRVKDAVVDALRAARGERPSVDVARPDLRLNLFVRGANAQLSVDLSGDSLHRRGYRQRAAGAPLKETLAAALLLMAGWPDLAREGRPFLDPMCGSGTLPIEAALIALDVAPGLLRQSFGMVGWGGHDSALWRTLRDEASARDRRTQGALEPVVAGCDVDAKAVAVARENAGRAGLARVVRLEQREIADWAPPAPGDGLIVVNPPYGKRLDAVARLRPLYRTIGDALKRRFGGWTAHVLSGSRELDGEVGLRPSKREVFFNGPIECRLLAFPIRAAQGESRGRPIVPDAPADDPELTAFKNRLRKRARHLAKWAAREGITCYRIYDADIPAFNAAIDRYEQVIHVQEYAPPREISDKAAAARRRALTAALPEVLNVDSADVYLKVRRRQRGRTQYEKLRARGELLEVRERGHRFLVNLTDYLDTGLFLDHRDTRKRLQELAAGRPFLNLFAYTGTATVYAAAGGATRSLTVDQSRTYLDWAGRNFEINGLDPLRHERVRADCLEWVKTHRGRYGLIFLDPPTFSNTKGKAGSWDVQRDHAWLVRRCVALLEPDGVLIFSTNSRRFRLDVEALGGLGIRDVSKALLPADFARRPNIHKVWEIRRSS